MIRIRRFNEQDVSNLNSNFWRWFGNSKVIDRKGKPLIVYHGSEQKLNIIEPGYSEPGAWFITNYVTAGNYAKGHNSYIHKVYLRVENPLTVYFDDNIIKPIIQGLSDEDMEEKGLYSNIAIVKYAERRSYDGVWFPDGNFTEDTTTWVVFSSYQVKSIYNDGSFDEDDNNIYS